jgi:uncharacterized protein (TIGR03083 family)
MEVTEHIAAVRQQGDVMAAAIGAAASDGPVPSCPGWEVRDLVRHQGGVHRWATAFVRHGITEAGDVDMDELVATFPGDDGMGAWFADGVTALVDALEAASPDLECWTFMAAPSPLAFWARRQAHETAIHRVDAELAAGVEPAACEAAFAADGIDELLTGFIPRRKPKPESAAGSGQGFRVRCTDADGDWLVRGGPDGVVTERRGGAGDCTASGPASDLYLTLWNRRSPTGLTVEGDDVVFREFLEATRIRWS